MLLGVVLICWYYMCIFTTPVYLNIRKFRVIIHPEYLQKVKHYGIAYGHFRISNIFVRVSGFFAVV